MHASAWVVFSSLSPSVCIVDLCLNLAGSWQGDYNGAAFDAKLAFVDIGKEGLDV